MKIFELDYLENSQLTDDDLYYLFDCNALQYSLVVGMFKFAGYKKYSDSKIIKIIQNDDKWVYKYFWKKYVRNNFEKKLIKIFKNVYWYTNTTATIKAQNWMIIYGLSIHGNNIDK